MKIKDYEITTSKIKKDTTIVSLNDLHFNQKTASRKYYDILSSIEKEKPNLVTVVGDILDDAKEVEERVFPFFGSLSVFVN